MMKKVFLLTFILSMLFSYNVFAENLSANNYRQILQSGNFLLDYQVTSFDSKGRKTDYKMNRTLAAKNNMRMYREGWELKGMLAFIGGGRKDYPDVLYREGKYYKFASNKKATMATWDQIKSPNIDPKVGWNRLQYELAIPEEFFALYPNDPYKYQSSVIKAPQFVGSNKKVIDNKQYDCDEYLLQINSQTGSVLGENLYYYYYENGKLIMIDKIMKLNGREIRLATFEIKELTDVVNDSLFSIPKGCDVYAVGMGDMNDLLEQPVKIEEY